MLKISLYISIILFSFFGFYFAQDLPTKSSEEITICHTGPSEMIAFLDDPQFLAFHPAPQEFDFEGMGSMVTFPSADGKDAAGYLIKAKEPSLQWLFVYQEWWGLNDNIKEEAEKFYNDLGGKVNVLALDMYDGKVTSKPQEAGTFMRGTNEKRLENIVLAARTFAGPEAKIANVGWCFGGAWSLKSALLLGHQNVGSIIYYGMPIREVDQLIYLNSDVLGLFATEEYISKAVIEEFALAMEAAGKELNYKIFDAVHGFANPSNAKHDKEATKEAYSMALSYLQKKFR